MPSLSPMSLGAWALSLVFSASAAATQLSIDLAKYDSSTSLYAPLEQVTISSCGAPAGSILTVRDGDDHDYLTIPASKLPVSFLVMGSLGNHHAILADSAGSILSDRSFPVDIRTAIHTGSGVFDHEFQKLQQELGLGYYKLIDGLDMIVHIPWLRDNYYSVKAAKYWDSDIKHFPELFLNSQRSDGMIYDLVNLHALMDPATGKPARANIRSAMWGNQWVGWTRDSSHSFERMPVEADVEYLAVLYTHLAWQASGDDRWMARMLPRLEKAMAYEMSNKLRWSPQFNLVKRAFSIDSWDYQHKDAARIHPSGNKNLLKFFDDCYIDSLTPMGILYADNAGMFQACRQLAAMFVAAGNAQRARHWDALADTFRVNTMKTCWNGTFFTHFVHLDSFPIDTSVHEEEMLSYSNPIAINRGITTHEQSVSILKEYQRRLVTNKKRAFAEWYTLDPPFPTGFDPVGEYMNGGISPIVAAELMKAAFEHGYEAYGADILNRVIDLHNRHGILQAAYRPLPPSSGWEKETFYPVNIRKAANRHFNADMPNGGIGEGNNDLRSFPTGKRSFAGKEFLVLDPAANSGKGLIVLNAADDRNGTDSVRITGINRTGKSIYFIQAASNIEKDRPVANYRIEYSDGSSEMIEIVPGRTIGSWWAGVDVDQWKAVWRGGNPVTPTLSMGIFGWNNPHPQKAIAAISFKSTGTSTVMVPALTISSAPVQLDNNDVTYGIPDQWATENMFWAIAEGLAGVTDNHTLLP